MTRRLINIATAMSALLSLTAVVMQVRSGYVTDSWELPPRSAPNFNHALQSGWVAHRIVESAAGRLVWINYDRMEKRLTPPVRYQMADEPLAPGQWGRDDRRNRRQLLVGLIGAEHGRIPCVAEWYLLPRGGRYVAVPWLTLALGGAVLPVARWLWAKRRVRAKAGPAFPVVSPEEEIGFPVVLACRTRCRSNSATGVSNARARRRAGGAGCTARRSTSAGTT
jgi:hypothetical protein